MTTESSMWKWLRQGVSLEVCLERHENLVGVGAPDVWGYHLKHGSFWIELKQSDGPKDCSKKTGIKVRQSQKIWFRKMCRLRCWAHWFLIQVGTRKYLVPGEYYGAVESMSENDLEYFRVSNHTPTELIDLAAKGF